MQWQPKNVCLLKFAQDSLLPTLYIQMDNTCRENKNKYVLTFVALLIQMGIFRKVKIFVYNYA